jgi:DNA-binding MarR family transcriptional regulator
MTMQSAKIRGETSSNQPLNDELPSPLVLTLLSLAKTTRALMGIRLADLGLHQGQDELLIALEIDMPVSVSTLSERLVVRPSTVSKMLDRLCAKGLVKRLPSPRDARLTLVKLTRDGQAAKTDVQLLWDMIGVELAGKMKPDGKDSMLGALGMIDGIIGSRLMRLR